MHNKINVLETFSGIGAQHAAIKKIKDKGKIFKIVATVDWDARAIISYAAIHHDLLKRYEITLTKNFLTTEENVVDFLNKYVISLDSKKPSTLKGKDYTFKKCLAASILLANNQVDITRLNPKLLEEYKINLITYSFPCQGLSIANMGRAKGINNSKSTSSLIWEIYRILKESSHKPKYLLMENVKNLLSNKFMPEYKKWLKILDEFGYKTFTTTINGIDSGSIQKRERVFALSVKKEIETPFDSDKTFTKYIAKIIQNKKLDRAGLQKYFKKVFDFSLDNPENIDALINDTPSRRKMLSSQKIINDSKSFVINTVTTKQDRIPCTGIIKLANNLVSKLNYRFITPREAYKLMGFTDKDFDKLVPLYKKGILTKESLYRQAGNSIVVEVIENLFEVIYQIEKGGKDEK
ncbi:DNA (cytosine-5-)-methyltransferase [Mycoplasmopsis californica]|uniref:DNA (cytosine-5-)-methyltransferase n=1 Tax=Mycoplasmopsis californica TaxID=2113 RepID=UPI000EB67325|nr:DNA (cytosine-5-)-methyltransferase [Mycoplasmopsis californica]BBG40739.1 DNA (cytosine-5-)-methyltransferase [Mycoplasmopsis californica]BBG41333.1 DNA (cytosine-5-)-methyltransferase [Mycoplasmopsis californica]BBG41926.1 DNA (cytosine-5-)-methyltransferase [Mycoplasmopsis californica]